MLAYGITPGGVMDGFAYRLGQRLVSNSPGSPAIEVAMGELTLRAGADLCFAVTGATVPVLVNDEMCPMNTTLRARAGDHIHLGRSESGNFSYLSIDGGIAVTPMFGSCSTVLREGLGGLNGDALKTGDKLDLGTATCISGFTAGKQPKSAGLPHLNLRYIQGYQCHQIDTKTLKLFHGASFAVTGQRDRMGARLAGPELRTGITQLWSEATCLGAIQVPPDGQPIVLLNDRQTVGGYPKLGAVLSVDCVRLAQAPLGTAVRFVPLSLSDADQVLWLHQNYEQELRLKPLGAL